MSFINLIKEHGWTEVQKSIEYKKNHWILTFDTSAWIEVGTESNQRVFDVPVPEENKEQWTLNLIEHLCETDDKLNKNSGN